MVLGSGLAQRQGDREDVVVGLVRDQFARQLGLDQTGLEVESAARRDGVVVGHRAGERDALLDRADVVVGEQFVEEAADLAHVARDFRDAALVGVELLEHHHRQVDVVLLEVEQRGRVVHQHVGVEDEQPFAGDLRLARGHHAAALRVRRPRRAPRRRAP